MFGTATTWLDAFRLNEGATTGTQSLPQIAGLRGGGFAAVWTDDTNNVDTALGTDIIGRAYDVHGMPVDDAFQVNTFAELDQETDADIAALPDGGFMVVYEQNGNDGDSDIQFQEFNALGGEVDEGNVAFGAAGADQVRNPSITIAGLNVFNQAFYNQMLVSYDHTLFGDANMLAARFGVDNAVSPPFDAGQNSTDDDRNGDSAVTGNSRVVTVYEEEDIGGTSIELYVSDQTGNFVGQGTISSLGDDPHVAGTPQGFMAVWMDNSGNVRARTYDTAGNLVGNTITVASGAASDLTSPAIVSTQDGYVIAWYNATTDALMGRSYFWNGGVASDAYVIETGAGIARPELGAMPDGRVAVTWEENGDVWAEIIDPRGSQIYGNNEDNTITSRPIGAQVFGEGGDDQLVGFAGNDILYGGGGDDYATGGEGNDIFDDRVDVNEFGTDIFFGNGGDDRVDVDTGDDVYYGGEGRDMLRFIDTSAAISIDLGQTELVLPNGGGTILYFDFEDVYGSAFNDTLIGTAAANSLDGYAGADDMAGGLGNDTYFTGEAGDSITELLDQGYDTVNASLTAYTLGANLERVNYLGDGDFVGTGNTLANRFQGSVGNDRFVDTFGGADIFSGGGGTDVVDFRASGVGAAIDIATGVHGGAAAGDSYSGIERFWGSNTAADTMTGDGAKNNFYGFGGNDVLTGSGHSDRLEGGAGNDTLNGSNDNDILNGGAGNDTLMGGQGADQFEYSAAGFNQDTVTDFLDGTDRLRVFTGFADDISDFAIAGNGTTEVVLSLAAAPANTITLTGAVAIAITNADFSFY